MGNNKLTKKEWGFYLRLLLCVVGVIALVSAFSGESSTASSLPFHADGPLDLLQHHFSTFVGFVTDHVLSTFGMLLLQIIVILIFARAVAWLFMKMGQPSVIGEIIAGILLGPSLFGLLFPEGYTFLFPEASLYNIKLLSQFGLILFMFVIGMELDLSEIQKNLKKSFIIAHAGIVVPFVLGALLALWLYKDYAGDEAALLPFALFIGISLSVTAFPVLARIIQEQGKMQSHLGILSMASAANGDITAWCVLAIIMALAQAGSPISALFTVLFAVLYILVMFLVIRPAFKVIGEIYNTRETVSKGIIAMIFMMLLISAYITEILGLHALFGAFIAGVVMPDNLKFRHIMTEKVEDVSLSIFLPLFFVSSGLQTEIGLLNTTTHWLIAGAITLVAIFGKVWGTYVACRVVGEQKRDSLYMGVLMNTRGLMELVILSMGFQLGILSSTIYAMLVIMTLVTTFMTTPTLNLVNKLWPLKKRITEGVYRILFSFGRQRSARVMLNIIKTFFPSSPTGLELIGMHMTIGQVTSRSDTEMFRQKSFEPVQAYATNLDLSLAERYEVTDNAALSIVRAAEEEQCQLLLVGASLELSSHPEDQEVSAKQKVFQDKVGVSLTLATSFFKAAQFFKDKTEIYVRHATCPVGIVIDRGLKKPAQSISILAEEDNPSYQKEIQRLLAQVSTADTTHPSLQWLHSSEELLSSEIKAQDLLLLSYGRWQQLVTEHPALISNIPTTLLLHTPSE